MRKAERKKVGNEAMRFLRGKYALDEVGNGTDEVIPRRRSDNPDHLYMQKVL